MVGPVLSVRTHIQLASLFGYGAFPDKIHDTRYVHLNEMQVLKICQGGALYGDHFTSVRESVWAPLACMFLVRLVEKQAMTEG